MPDEFTHDVFLSHSATDKAVVRPLAEPLQVAVRKHLEVWPVSPKSPREGGFDEWVLKAGDALSSGERARVRASQIEEGLEHSRVLARPAVAPARRRMLCMSAHAFGSDWAQLEAGTCGRGNLRFRDPLNKERRLIPPAARRRSLAQFLYIYINRRSPEIGNFQRMFPDVRRMSSRTSMR